MSEPTLADCRNLRATSVNSSFPCSIGFFTDFGLSPDWIWISTLFGISLPSCDENSREVPLKSGDHLALDRFVPGRWPQWRSYLVLIKPETVVGWHRRLSVLLDLEEPPASRSAEDQHGDVKDNPRDDKENPLWGRRESTVSC